jgi:hypothetical protein
MLLDAARKAQAGPMHKMIPTTSKMTRKGFPFIPVSSRHGSKDVLALL